MWLSSPCEFLVTLNFLDAVCLGHESCLPISSVEFQNCLCFTRVLLTSVLSRVLCSMEPVHDEVGGDAVEKAVRAASLARSAKKRADKAAKQALDVARREMKRTGKVIEARKSDARKKTVISYFQSSCGNGAG